MMTNGIRSILVCLTVGTLLFTGFVPIVGTITVSALNYGKDTPINSIKDSIRGEAANDWAAHSIAMNGDLNGDGYNDLVISSFYHDPPGLTDAGKVYVIFGSKDGSNLGTNKSLSTANASFTGVANWDNVGQYMAIVGDINGDGYDDLAISSIFNSHVYLIFGKQNGWQKNVSLANADASFISNISATGFGVVTGIGDVNGDGFDDFAIGDPISKQGGVMKGSVYLVFGKATGWKKDMSFANDKNFNASILGTAKEAWFGYSIHYAGDLNRDGIDDFVVAAPFFNNSGSGNAGKVYIFFGKHNGWHPNMTDADADASIVGTAAWERFGLSLLGGSDFDGNGYDDLLIFHDQNYGSVYIFYGNETRWVKNANSSTADASFNGSIGGTALGISYVNLGDLNSDGTDDVVIGDPNANAFITFGKKERYQWGSDRFDTPMYFTDTVKEGFPRVLAAGDIDGDGLKDLAIGSVINGDIGPYSGKAYIAFLDHNYRPSAISSLKAYKYPGCTIEVSVVKENDTVCLELKGTDANSSRVDTALVEVINNAMPNNKLKVNFIETGPATGTYRGNFTVKNVTSARHNWIGAKFQDTITATSLDDRTKNVTVEVSTIFIALRPLTDITTSVEDELYSQQYFSIGLNPATDWTWDTNASWLQMGAVNHTLYGIPNNGDIGTYGVRINVTDGLAHYDQRSFNVTILNAPTNITSPMTDVTTAIQSQLYSVDYNGSDEGQGPAYYELVSNATWLHINTTTGVLNGTPTPFDLAEYSVIVRFYDGHGSMDQRSFKVKVQDINDVPFIEGQNVTDVLEDKDYLMTYTATDYDAKDVLTWDMHTNATAWLKSTVAGKTISLFGTPLNEHIGRYWVNISVDDAHGGNASKNVTINVINVNDPPVVSGTGAASAVVLYNFTYQVIASDVDFGDVLEYSLTKAPANMTIDDKSGLVVWMPRREQRGPNQVCINVTDGNATTIYNLSITVDVPKPTLVYPQNDASVDKLTPTLLWSLEHNGSQPVVYDVYLDNSTMPTISLAQGVSSTELLLTTPLHDLEDYYWYVIPRTGDVLADPSPVWHFSVDTGFVVEHRLQLELDQSSLRIYRSSSRSQVLTVNVSITNLGNVRDTIGLTVQGTPDMPGGSASLIPTVELASNASVLHVMTITVPAKAALGKYTFTVKATAGNATVSKTLTLTIEKKSSPTTNILGSPLFIGSIAVLIICIAAIGAFAIISSRKRKRAEKELAEQKAKADEVKDFNIDEIFLIYKDGRLISHISNVGQHVDEELFASMLVAIQSFVQESCRTDTSDSGLSSFEYGSKKMILEKGQHTIVVVALSGTEPEILKGQMQELVQKVEGLYSGPIEKWDGSKESLKDIEVVLAPLFKIKEGLKIKAEKEEVRVASGIEFFGGFVRVKIAVKNGLSSGISGIHMNVSYNDRTLRFSHIEPAYPMKGKVIDLDPMKAQEKATVALYLDPLICQESFVDCTVTFKDEYGTVGEVKMKTRPVDIICPIFHTPENINVAMLKRLLDKLDYSDSRIFKLPAGIGGRDALDIAKEPVQKHDIKLVREHSKKEPFKAEVWYYGMTTTEQKEELVLRLSLIDEVHLLEVYVASSNLSTMTGLLAEVGNNISANFRNNGHGHLEASLDPGLKEYFKARSLFLDEEESAPKDENPTK